MGRTCDLTGKRTRVGNKVSHANNKTKRKFKVNLKTKRVYLPKEKEWITLRLSTKAIKSINKNGIYSYFQSN